MLVFGGVFFWGEVVNKLVVGGAKSFLIFFKDLVYFWNHFPLFFTLPETNSSHLKMDGWKMILSFWGPHLAVLFQGVLVTWSFVSRQQRVLLESREKSPSFRRPIELNIKKQLHGSNQTT